MTALLRFVKRFTQVNEIPKIDRNIKYKFMVYYFILEVNNTQFLHS
jgi:hypothetical protein